MHILGLSGYARSGKDEAAKVLVEQYGYRRVAFADKLREVLYALNPKLGSVDYGQGTASREYRIRDFIDEFGWDGYKEAGPYHAALGRETRELLQRLGTEAGRNILGNNIWVDSAFIDIPDTASVVVTDVRFPNEALAIKERGGDIVRIERKGVGPVVGTDGIIHPSETSLDDWPFDYTLHNNFDTVGAYRGHIADFMEFYQEDLYFKNVIGEMP